MTKDQLTIRQEFFISRIIELLHTGTLDSYRVRTHNTHTVILELHSLIEEWRKGNIKQFETLVHCALEAKEKFEEDQVYLSNFPLRDLIPAYLNAFMESKGKPIGCLRIQQFLGEILLQMNGEQYILALYDNLENILTTPDSSDGILKKLETDLNKIDSFLSCLCTELIHLGFSKKYLYSMVKKIHKESHTFKEFFDTLKESTEPSKKRNFIIIFRANVGKQINDFNYPELKHTFPEEYKTDYILKRRSNFINCEKNQRFFVVKTSTLDEESAIKDGKEILSRYLDKIHLANNYSRIIPEVSTLVLEKTSDTYFVIPKSSLPIIDGFNNFGEPGILAVPEMIDTISRSTIISKEVINRLSAALRHLRIGDSDTEIEQRFINYWIALEFLFSTPMASDSTFGRIKENLINILTACYGKRNIKHLDNQIRQEAGQSQIPHIWESNAISIIESQIKLPILLRYRLHKYETHLLSGDNKSIRGYLERHKKNVIWQIARIYRLRNELIHEAAIRHNIESLTSNLRYYLIVVLNNIILYFYKKEINLQPNQNVLDMESFFMYYDLIKLSVEKNSSLDNILGSLEDLYD